MIKRAGIICRRLFRVISPRYTIRVIISDNCRRQMRGRVLRDETLGFRLVSSVPPSNIQRKEKRRGRGEEKKFSWVLELARDNERE